MSEFARPVRLDEIGTAPATRRIAADAPERAAVAARLGLLELARLEAGASVRRVTQGVEVTGEVEADATQACVLTGLPVPARVREPFSLRFVAGAAAAPGADDIELADADLDLLPLDGGAIDLGEVAVQTLALALPAFPRAHGPEAEAARALLLSEEEAAAQAEADRRAASPFAALARNA